ncbi:MAG: 3-hydroxyacyl-CoA dehydrogenase [Verrucomicrobia bacterium]|nr:MAG: 3-hydroxyacyl-CoA dehydrogenase [Verrucomicrobiota bacterium]
MLNAGAELPENIMKNDRIKTVACVGAGTIGSSWATFFASKGLDVRLYDIDQAILIRGYDMALENLVRMESMELLGKGEAEIARRRIQKQETLEGALAGVDLVQESVREDYKTKADLFERLEPLVAPGTVIASSSSGLLMTRMQSVLEHPERSLIAHPFNPPHLVPLVELVPGEQTDPAVLETAKTFFQELGKVPVVLKKEVPGHIANRLAAALWRESIDLVASGVASVEDVDNALRAGPGLRWALMGQHLIYHLGGGEGGYRHMIDHIGKSFDAYWKTMPTWTEIPDEAKEQIISGVENAVGDRSIQELVEERDRNLARILKALG